MFELDTELSDMALLKFHDFVPKQLSKNIWTGQGKYEPLVQSLRDANAWMVANPQLDIINVETVVLPNIHNPKEEGSTDPELVVITGGSYSGWHQFIRVWFMESKT